MAPHRLPAQVDEYRKLVADRLQLDMTTADAKHRDGPLIDIADVAILGGLTGAAVAMAKQRTRLGTARVPFPDKDPDVGSRFDDKPMYRAYLVLDYYVRSGNWPLGTAARPLLRKPGSRPPVARPEDKMNWTALRTADPELAGKIQENRLNDGSRRSIEQWNWRLEHVGRATAPAE